MDAKLIERLDRQRYKSMVWQTVGFFLFAGSMTVGELILKRPYNENSVIIVLIALLGFIFGGIGAGMHNSIKRRIKRDPELKKALNNELIKLYDYKSLKLGVITAWVSLLFIYLLEIYFPVLTIKIACLIVLYISGLSMYISQLVYLRR